MTTLHLLLAFLHLLALGIGLGAVWGRARALRGPLDAQGLRRVFYTDTAWGLAALLWIGTGLARFLGPFEKGTAYYLGNHLFLTKMGLLALILVVEIGPMVTLIRWRRRQGRGETLDTSAAMRMARISIVEAVLIVAMVACAVGMARGVGAA